MSHNNDPGGFGDRRVPTGPRNAGGGQGERGGRGRGRGRGGRGRRGRQGGPGRGDEAGFEGGLNRENNRPQQAVVSQRNSTPQGMPAPYRGPSQGGGYVSTDFFFSALSAFGTGGLNSHPFAPALNPGSYSGGMNGSTFLSPGGYSGAMNGSTFMSPAPNPGGMNGSAFTSTAPNPAGGYSGGYQQTGYAQARTSAGRSSAGYQQGPQTPTTAGFSAGFQQGPQTPTTAGFSAGYRQSPQTPTTAGFSAGYRQGPQPPAAAGSSSGGYQQGPQAPIIAGGSGGTGNEQGNQRSNELRFVDDAYYPSHNHVDQSRTVDDAGNGQHYGRCFHCGRLKGKECPARHSDQCKAKCCHCKGSDHPGEPCPRLYCSIGWWMSRYGMLPSSVRIRPNPRNAELLVQRGHKWFASLPNLNQVHNQGMKRKREETQQGSGFEGRNTGPWEGSRYREATQSSDSRAGHNPGDAWYKKGPDAGKGKEEKEEEKVKEEEEEEENVKVKEEQQEEKEVKVKEEKEE